MEEVKGSNPFGSTKTLKHLQPPLNIGARPTYGPRSRFAMCYRHYASHPLAIKLGGSEVRFTETRGSVFIELAVYSFLANRPC